MTLWTSASGNGMVCTRLIILQWTVLHPGTIFLKTYLRDLESSQKQTETGGGWHLWKMHSVGFVSCSFSPDGTSPQILC